MRPENLTHQPNSHQIRIYCKYGLWDISGLVFGYEDVGAFASLKSEKAAFRATLELMGECGVQAKSVRLDQYYASQSTAAAFEANTTMYLIPKSNATIRGSYVWKDMIVDLMSYPFLFLSEYFRREHSESGFSADKRCVMAGRFGRDETTEYTQQRCAKAFGTISSG